MESRISDEEILFVQLDPVLLSSYMARLSLENAPEIPESPDEIVNNDDHLDDDDISFALKAKNDQSHGNFYKDYDKSLTTSLSSKSCVTEKDVKDIEDKPVRAKDINGNDDTDVEDVKDLIGNLVLSDTENEEVNEGLNIRKRGADRICHRSKNREQNTSRRNEYDKSQFNSRRLRFLSGASNVQINTSLPTPELQYLGDYDVNVSRNRNVFTENQSCNYFQNSGLIFSRSSAIQNEVFIPANSASLFGNFDNIFSQSSLGKQTETVNQIQSGSPFHENFTVHFASTSLNPSENCYPISNYKDKFHADPGTNAVSSPESGYDTSTSPSASPPLTTIASSNLDIIAESFERSSGSFDEEEVLNFLSEFESLDDYSFAPISLCDEDHKKKEIYDFLKDNQVEGNESYLNREPKKSGEISKLVLENVLTGPSESICIGTDANEESVLAELNELFQSVPDVHDGYAQVKQNQLSPSLGLVNDECVQRDFNKLSNITPALNAECLPTELCVSSPVSQPVAGNQFVPLVHSLDLNSTSNIGIAIPDLSQCNQNVSGARIARRPLNDKAKQAFRKSLPDEDFHAAQAKIYKKINEDKRNKKKVKVIYIEDEEDKTSDNQTNLHRAVLNFEFSEIYCLVEAHKQNVDRLSNPFADLNLRDRHRKTALDYAIEKNLTLVIDYLKENNVCKSPQI